MNKKKVDVVIPVYHPGSEFKKLMERLERQTYEVNRIFQHNGPSDKGRTLRLENGK